MVFRMLRRTLGRDDEVEDLAQDIFLCVFQKAHTLRRPRALKAFIISVTVLTSRQELRRRWARRRLPPAAAELGVEADSITGRSDAREALLRFYRILDRLRPTDRAVFVLRFMEALALEEVAARSPDRRRARRRAARRRRRRGARARRRPERPCRAPRPARRRPRSRTMCRSHPFVNYSSEIYTPGRRS